MHIAVCDDNAQVLKDLETKLRAVWKQPFTLAVFPDGEALLAHAKTQSIDILITDIKMPGMDGIALTKQLKDAGTQFIFISAYTEYAEAVFAVAPIYYLLKPVTEERLFEALTRAEEVRKRRQRTFQMVSKKRTLRFFCDEIFYVESRARNVIFHTTGGTSEAVAKLSDVKNGLPAEFLYCHKSYLVNTEKIQAVSNYKIRLTSGETLPVARSRYAEVKQAVLRLWGEEI